jgi:hypothetical protein
MRAIIIFGNTRYKIIFFHKCRFSNLNQKFLGTYVEIQQQINLKRQAEFEENQLLLMQKQAAESLENITAPQPQMEEATTN